MKSLIVTLALVTSLNAFAAVGGDEVRNGGGSIEQYFIYALKNLPDMIDRCVASKVCARRDDQKELLKKIKNSVHLEIAADVLKFYLPADHSEFFMIDGMERLAITGSSVGSPIYYNTRLLYRLGPKAGLGLAIQSLIHELGHHHGAIDHDALDLLGSEVRELMTSITMELPYTTNGMRASLNRSAMTALLIEKAQENTSGLPTIVLMFKSGPVDIGNLFVPVMQKCDKDISVPTLTDPLKIYNLHWDFKANELNSPYRYLAGNIDLYCKDKSAQIVVKNFKFNVKITISGQVFYSYVSSELETAPELIYSKQLKYLRR